MKKSELIKSEIEKIEASRPALGSYIDAHTEADVPGGFLNSSLYADYELNIGDYYKVREPLICHLKVALSVAIADEYLESINNEKIEIEKKVELNKPNKMITIKRWDNGTVIHSGEFSDVKECLEDGVAKGIDFSFADLTCADLPDADLTDAIMTCAIMTGANLMGANLTCANLTDANLTDANLTGAIMTGAIMRWSIMTCANLTDANLTDANLTGAIMTGAIMRWSIMTCAIMTRAIMIDVEK